MLEKQTTPQFLPTPLVRTMALALSLCMLVGDPSWAAGISDFLHTNFSSDLRTLTVPVRFGSITEKWFYSSSPAAVSGGSMDPGLRHAGMTAKNSSPLVVLIQDLHANIGVQNNIAGAIEYLHRRYGVSALFTEAAFGPCDVSLFRLFPSRSARRDLVDRLLSKALLSGAEVAAIQTDRGVLSPLKLEGVDDPLLYFANVEAFRDLRKVGIPAAQEWRDLKDILLPGASPELRKHLDLVTKLLMLKMVEADWAAYKAHRDLTPQGSPTFQKAIAAAERFYTAAEARNGVLVENLLQRIGLNSSSPAVVSGGSMDPGLRHAGMTAKESLQPIVLVTGGFHTQAIAQELKAQGISYAILTPHVEYLDQDQLYVQSLTEPPHETVMAVSGTMKLVPTGLQRVVSWAKEYTFARKNVSNHTADKALRRTGKSPSQISSTNNSPLLSRTLAWGSGVGIFWVGIGLITAGLAAAAGAATGASVALVGGSIAAIVLGVAAISQRHRIAGLFQSRAESQPAPAPEDLAPEVAENGAPSAPASARTPTSWGQIILWTVALSILLYFSLSPAGGFIASLAPEAADSQIGFHLPNLLHSVYKSVGTYLVFTGNVVVVFTLLNLVARIFSETAGGKQLAKGYTDWVKASNDAGRAKRGVVHTLNGLVLMMYGFAFERVDRLFKIWRHGLEAVRDASRGEKWFARQNNGVVKAFSFPFIAATGIVSSRVQLKIKRTIAQGLLIAVLGTLLLAVAWAAGNPAASVGWLSHSMGWNILDPLSSGWIARGQFSPFVHALLMIGSPFGALSSFMLSLLMIVMGETSRSWMEEHLRAEKAQEKARGQLRVRAKAVVQAFREGVPVRNGEGAYQQDAEGKLVRQSVWKAALPQTWGLMTVNAEIEGFKALSHPFGYLNELVLKVEGPSGVVGVGELVSHDVLHPLGINPDAAVAYLPGTGGLTSEQLGKITDLPVRVQEAKAEAEKLGKAINALPPNQPIPEDTLKTLRGAVQSERQFLETQKERLRELTPVTEKERTDHEKSRANLEDRLKSLESVELSLQKNLPLKEGDVKELRSLQIEKLTQILGFEKEIANLQNQVNDQNSSWWSRVRHFFHRESAAKTDSEPTIPPVVPPPPATPADPAQAAPQSKTQAAARAGVAPDITITPTKGAAAHLAIPGFIQRSATARDGNDVVAGKTLGYAKRSVNAGYNWANKGLGENVTQAQKATALGNADAHRDQMADRRQREVVAKLKHYRDQLNRKLPKQLEDANIRADNLSRDEQDATKQADPLYTFKTLDQAKDALDKLEQSLDAAQPEEALKIIQRVMDQPGKDSALTSVLETMQSRFTEIAELAKETADQRKVAEKSLSVLRAVEDKIEQIKKEKPSAEKYKKLADAAAEEKPLLEVLRSQSITLHDKATALASALSQFRNYENQWPLFIKLVKNNPELKLLTEGVSADQKNSLVEGINQLTTEIPGTLFPLIQQARDAASELQNVQNLHGLDVALQTALPQTQQEQTTIKKQISQDDADKLRDLPRDMLEKMQGKMISAIGGTKVLEDVSTKAQTLIDRLLAANVNKDPKVQDVINKIAEFRSYIVILQDFFKNNDLLKAQPAAKFALRDALVATFSAQGILGEWGDSGTLETMNRQIQATSPQNAEAVRSAILDLRKDLHQLYLPENAALDQAVMSLFEQENRWIENERDEAAQKTLRDSVLSGLERAINVANPRERKALADRAQEQAVTLSDNAEDYQVHPIAREANESQFMGQLRGADSNLQKVVGSVAQALVGHADEKQAFDDAAQKLQAVKVGDKASADLNVPLETAIDAVEKAFRTLGANPDLFADLLLKNPQAVESMITTLENLVTLKAADGRLRQMVDADGKPVKTFDQTRSTRTDKTLYVKVGAASHDLVNMKQTLYGALKSESFLRSVTRWDLDRIMKVAALLTYVDPWSSNFIGTLVERVGKTLNPDKRLSENNGNPGDNGGGTTPIGDITGSRQAALGVKRAADVPDPTPPPKTVPLEGLILNHFFKQHWVDDVVGIAFGIRNVGYNVKALGELFDTYRSVWPKYFREHSEFVQVDPSILDDASDQRGAYVYVYLGERGLFRLPAPEGHQVSPDRDWQEVSPGPDLQGKDRLANIRAGQVVKYFKTKEGQWKLFYYVPTTRASDIKKFADVLVLTRGSVAFIQGFSGRELPLKTSLQKAVALYDGVVMPIINLVRGVGDLQKSFSLENAVGKDVGRWMPAGRLKLESFTAGDRKYFTIRGQKGTVFFDSVWKVPNPKDPKKEYVIFGIEGVPLFAAELKDPATRLEDLKPDDIRYWAYWRSTLPEHMLDEATFFKQGISETGYYHEIQDVIPRSIVRDAGGTSKSVTVGADDNAVTYKVGPIGDIDVPRPRRSSDKSKPFATERVHGRFLLEGNEPVAFWVADKDDNYTEKSTILTLVRGRAGEDVYVGIQTGNLLTLEGTTNDRQIKIIPHVDRSMLTVLGRRIWGVQGSLFDRKAIPQNFMLGSEFDQVKLANGETVNRYTLYRSVDNKGQAIATTDTGDKIVVGYYVLPKDAKNHEGILYLYPGTGFGENFIQDIKAGRVNYLPADTFPDMPVRQGILDAMGNKDLHRIRELGGVAAGAFGYYRTKDLDNPQAKPVFVEFQDKDGYWVLLDYRDPEDASKIRATPTLYRWGNTGGSEPDHQSPLSVRMKKLSDIEESLFGARVREILDPTHRDRANQFQTEAHWEDITDKGTAIDPEKDPSLVARTLEDTPGHRVVLYVSERGDRTYKKISGPNNEFRVFSWTPGEREAARLRYDRLHEPFFYRIPIPPEGVPPELLAKANEGVNQLFDKKTQSSYEFVLQNGEVKNPYILATSESAYFYDQRNLDRQRIDPKNLPVVTPLSNKEGLYSYEDPTTKTVYEYVINEAGKPTEAFQLGASAKNHLGYIAFTVLTTNVKFTGEAQNKVSTPDYLQEQLTKGGYTGVDQMEHLRTPQGDFYEIAATHIGRDGKLLTEKIHFKWNVSYPGFYYTIQGRGQQGTAPAPVFLTPEPDGTTVNFLQPYRKGLRQAMETPVTLQVPTGTKQFRVYVEDASPNWATVFEELDDHGQPVRIWTRQPSLAAGQDRYNELTSEKPYYAPETEVDGKYDLESGLNGRTHADGSYYKQVIAENGQPLQLDGWSVYRLYRRDGQEIGFKRVRSENDVTFYQRMVNGGVPAIQKALNLLEKSPSRQFVQGDETEAFNLRVVALEKQTYVVGKTYLGIVLKEPMPKHGYLSATEPLTVDEGNIPYNLFLERFMVDKLGPDGKPAEKDGKHSVGVQIRIQVEGDRVLDVKPLENAAAVHRTDYLSQSIPEALAHLQELRDDKDTWKAVDLKTNEAAIFLMRVAVAREKTEEGYYFKSLPLKDTQQAVDANGKRYNMVYYLVDKNGEPLPGAVFVAHVTTVNGEDVIDRAMQKTSSVKLAQDFLTLLESNDPHQKWVPTTDSVSLQLIRNGIHFKGDPILLQPAKTPADESMPGHYDYFEAYLGKTTSLGISVRIRRDTGAAELRGDYLMSSRKGLEKEIHLLRTVGARREIAALGEGESYAIETLDKIPSLPWTVYVVGPEVRVIKGQEKLVPVVLDLDPLDQQAQKTGSARKVVRMNADLGPGKTTSVVIHVTSRNGSLHRTITYPNGRTFDLDSDKDHQFQAKARVGKDFRLGQDLRLTGHIDILEWNQGYENFRGQQKRAFGTLYRIGQKPELITSNQSSLLSRIQRLDKTSLWTGKPYYVDVPNAAPTKLNGDALVLVENGKVVGVFDTSTRGQRRLASWWWGRGYMITNQGWIPYGGRPNPDLLRENEDGSFDVVRNGRKIGRSVTFGVQTSREDRDRWAQKRQWVMDRAQDFSQGWPYNFAESFFWRTYLGREKVQGGYVLYFLSTRHELIKETYGGVDVLRKRESFKINPANAAQEGNLTQKANDLIHYLMSQPDKVVLRGNDVTKTKEAALIAEAKGLMHGSYKSQTFGPGGEKNPLEKRELGKGLVKENGVWRPALPTEWGVVERYQLGTETQTTYPADYKDRSLAGKTVRGYSIIATDVRTPALQIVSFFDSEGRLLWQQARVGTQQFNKVFFDLQSGLPVYTDRGNGKGKLTDYTFETRTPKGSNERFLVATEKNAHGDIISESVRDAYGHLIWEWKSSSMSLKVYKYEMVVLPDGRVINGTPGVREHATVEVQYRIDQKKLDTLLNPKDAQLLSLGGEVLGLTYFDPEYGETKPVLHVKPSGEIDEIYSVGPMNAKGEKDINAFRLPPGKKYVQRPTMDQYKDFLGVYQKEGANVEVRTIDALGRLTRVQQGILKADLTCKTIFDTHHLYRDDDPFALLHSQLDFNGQKVWDVYYPAFDNGWPAFKDALLGVPQDSIERGLQDAVAQDPNLHTSQERAARLKELKEDVLKRMHESGLIKIDPTQLQGKDREEAEKKLADMGWGNLPEKIRSGLENKHLSALTNLQVAVVVSANGGISVDYRLPGDPLEQLVMSNKGADRTISVNWDGRYVTDSYKLTDDNQITARYETQAERQKVGDLEILKNNPEILKAMVSGQLIKIDENTSLPVVKETLYAPEGTIQEDAYARTHRAKEVDPNHINHVRYDTRPLKWSDKVKTINMLYILPDNPLGVDVVKHFGWNGYAVNKWWLMGTPIPSEQGGIGRSAPIGILPGSYLLDNNGNRKGEKSFREPDPSDPGYRVDPITGKGKQYRELSILGADGIMHTQRIYEYTFKDLPGDEHRLGDAYSVLTGRLIFRKYDWLRFRGANVLVWTKGKEYIFYDPSLPFEMPVYGIAYEENKETAQSKPIVTRVLVKDIFEKQGNQDTDPFKETQWWRWREPLVGERWGTLEQPLKNGVEQTPTQQVVGDFFEEFVAKSTGYKAVVAAIVALPLVGWLISGFLAKRNRKKRLAQDEQKESSRRAEPTPLFRSLNPPKRVVSDDGTSRLVYRPDDLLSIGPRLTEEQEKQLKVEIEKILREMGVVDFNLYNVDHRVLAEIRDQNPAPGQAQLNPDNIFGDLKAMLARWREKTGKNSGSLNPHNDGRDKLREIVFIEWITEEMVLDGLANIGDFPNGLSYFWDKAIALYNRRPRTPDQMHQARREVTQPIRAELTALRDYLWQEYSHERNGKVNPDDLDILNQLLVALAQPKVRARLKAVPDNQWVKLKTAENPHEPLMLDENDEKADDFPSPYNVAPLARALSLKPVSLDWENDEKRDELKALFDLARQEQGLTPDHVVKVFTLVFGKRITENTLKTEYMKDLLRDLEILDLDNREHLKQISKRVGEVLSRIGVLRKELFLTVDDFEDNFGESEFIARYENKVEASTTDSRHIRARQFYESLNAVVPGKASDKTHHDQIGLSGMIKNVGAMATLVFVPASWIVLVPAYFALSVAYPVLGTAILVLLLASLVMWVYSILSLARLVKKAEVPPLLSTVQQNLPKEQIFSWPWWKWKFLNFFFWGATLVVWGGLSGYLNWIALSSIPHFISVMGLGSLLVVPVVLLLVVGGTVLSIFQIPTFIGLFFSHFSNSRDGMGQIRTVEDALLNMGRARDRAGSLLLPKDARTRWQGRPGADLQGENLDQAINVEIWRRFWTEFLNKHLRSKEREDWIISLEVEDKLKNLLNIQNGAQLRQEAQEISKLLQHNPDADRRIRRAIEGFLMLMPYAREWDRTPALTVMSTGFNEPVKTKYKDVNDSEAPGMITRLNKVVLSYPEHWLLFLRTFKDEAPKEWREKAVKEPDPVKKKDFERKARESEQGYQILLEHTRAVSDGELTRLVPDKLPESCQKRVQEWTAARMMPLAKTIKELAIFRDVFEFMGRLNFPQATDEEIVRMVDNKLQIFINYNGVGVQGMDKEGTVGNTVILAEQEEVKKLARKYPFITEIRWGRQLAFRISRGQGEGEMNVERFYLPLGEPFFPGKPFAQNEILPFIRHNKIFFFDVNASVWFEEAIRTFNGLAEFADDPSLRFVLFGEQTYTKNFSDISEVGGMSDETWTQDEQSLLSMFRVVGFYGHSAIIDRQALIVAGGFPHHFTGEDTIMTIKFLLEGFRTVHRVYMLYGKSRMAAYYEAIVAIGRWSQNTAEYFVSRYIVRLQRRGGAINMGIARLLMLFRSLAFYVKKPLIPIYAFFYLNWVVLFGVTMYAQLEMILLFGALGLLLNQAGALPALSHSMREKGSWRGFWDFVVMFPKLYLFNVGVIPTMGARFFSAWFSAVGGFAISAKGFGLSRFSLNQIYSDGSEVKTWNTRFGKIPKLLFLQAGITFGLVVFALVPLTWAHMLGVFGLMIGMPIGWQLALLLSPKLRDEVWSRDAIQRKPVRVQMLASIPQIASIVIALIFWGGLIGSFSTWAMLFWLTATGSIGYYLYSGFKVNDPHSQSKLKEYLQATDNDLYAAPTSEVNLEDHGGVNQVKRKWARRTLYSFWGILASVALGTYLASPMFLLFTFSIFYIGVPFAMLWMPLLGHVSPWVRLKMARFRQEQVHHSKDSVHEAYDQMSEFKFVIPKNGVMPEYTIAMKNPVGTLQLPKESLDFEAKDLLDVPAIKGKIKALAAAGDPVGLILVSSLRRQSNLIERILNRPLPFFGADELDLIVGHADGRMVRAALNEVLDMPNLTGRFAIHDEENGLVLDPQHDPFINDVFPKKTDGREIFDNQLGFLNDDKFKKKPLHQEVRLVNKVLLIKTLNRGVQHPLLRHRPADKNIDRTLRENISIGDIIFSVIASEAIYNRKRIEDLMQQKIAGHMGELMGRIQELLTKKDDDTKKYFDPESRVAAIRQEVSNFLREDRPARRSANYSAEDNRLARRELHGVLRVHTYEGDGDISIDPKGGNGDALNAREEELLRMGRAENDAPNPIFVKDPFLYWAWLALRLRVTRAVPGINLGALDDPAQVQKLDIAQLYRDFSLLPGLSAVPDLQRAIHEMFWDHEKRALLWAHDQSYAYSRKEGKEPDKFTAKDLTKEINSYVKRESMKTGKTDDPNAQFRVATKENGGLKELVRPLNVSLEHKQDLARAERRRLIGGFAPMFYAGGDGKRMNVPESFPELLFRKREFSLFYFTYVKRITSADTSDRIHWGARAFLRYRQDIEYLANKHFDLPESMAALRAEYPELNQVTTKKDFVKWALAQQRWVVLCSQEELKYFQDDFEEHKFYGFEPENIFLIADRGHHHFVYDVEDETFKIVELDDPDDLEKYGHAPATERYAFPNEAYQATRPADDEDSVHWRRLPGTIADAINARFKQHSSPIRTILLQQRINDVRFLHSFTRGHKLKTNVIDPELDLFAMDNIEGPEQYRFVNEFVVNPPLIQKRGDSPELMKGGLPFQIKIGDKFYSLFLDGLAAKDSDTSKIMDEALGADPRTGLKPPAVVNRMAGYIHSEALIDVLQSGLPFYFEDTGKKGSQGQPVYKPQGVSGDISLDVLIMKSLQFYLSEQRVDDPSDYVIRILYDFKTRAYSMKMVAKDVVEEMDSDPVFIRLAEHSGFKVRGSLLPEVQVVRKRTSADVEAETVKYTDQYQHGIAAASPRGFKSAAVAIQALALVPFLGALGAIQSGDLALGSFLGIIGGALALALTPLSEYFVSLASRMVVARDQAALKGPKEGTLIDEFSNPAIGDLISARNLGLPINDFRDAMAGVLLEGSADGTLTRGMIVADKTALSHLSADDQYALLQHELDHLGLSSFNDYLALLERGQLANRPILSEAYVLLQQAARRFFGRHHASQSPLSRLPAQSA